jgi:hypothetical protein
VFCLLLSQTFANKRSSSVWYSRNPMNAERPVLLRISKQTHRHVNSWTYGVLPCVMFRRSRWSRGLRNGSAAASLLGLRVRIPPGALLWVLCVGRWSSLRRVNHSSRGVPPTVVFVNVIVKARQWGGPGPLGAVAPWRRVEVQKMVYEFRCYTPSSGPYRMPLISGLWNLMKDSTPIE